MIVWLSRPPWHQRWRSSLLLALLAHASCISADTVECGSTLCPPGSRCSPDGQLCIPEGCGDGVLGRGEDCEPGLDFSSRTCTDFGFYEAAGLQCSITCSFEVSSCTGGYCGDGELQGGDEDCDGAPRPGARCVDFGFDRGPIDCLESECVHDLHACGRLRFQAQARTKGQEASSIWGTAPDNIFLGSPGGLERFDGFHWTRVELGESAAGGIAGVGGVDDTVVAVGGDRILRSVDGGMTWSVFQAPGDVLARVWASAADDIWVVGSTSDTDKTGAVWHFDGQAWSRLSLPEAGQIRDVWVSPQSGTVYLAGLVAGGGGGAVGPLDGETWLYEVLDGGVVDALWGTSDSDLWVSGNPTGLAHFDGVGWTFDRWSPGNATDIFGVSADEVYACSASGSVFRFDGHRWVPLWLEGDPRLLVVWADGQGRVYTAGGSANAFVGGPDYYGRTVTLADARLRSVYSPDPDSALAVGFDATWTSFEHEQWAQPSSLLGGGLFLALWGRALDDAWAITYSTIYHYDGDSWVDEQYSIGGPSTIDANGIWGFPDGQIFVVSNKSVHHRSVGGAWNPVVLPVEGLFFHDVWGPSADDVWVVGEAGTIVRYDGAAWSTLSSPELNPFSGVTVSAVWGSAADDVWLGTALGELYHYDGSTISAFDRETFALPILAIHGTAADDVFALSEHQLAHFDGRRWSSVAVPGDYVMRDVWAHPERVFVVGFDGLDPVAFVPTIVRTTSWTAE